MGSAHLCCRASDNDFPLNPRYVYSHTNLSLRQLDRGLIDDAILHFEAALEVNPGLTLVRRWLDRARARQRESRGIEPRLCLCVAPRRN